MILLVHGPPAAGKSTLAAQLSQRLQWPHISRDNLTEWMVDCTHEPSKEVMKALNHIGYNLMFKLGAELSRGKHDFILEGCINPVSGGEHIQRLFSLSHHHLVEVFITASSEVLCQRYAQRAQTEQRHTAHGDETQRVEELRNHLKTCNYQPLGIGDLLIEVDSTDDLTGGFEQVMLALSRF